MKKLTKGDFLVIKEIKPKISLLSWDSDHSGQEVILNSSKKKIAWTVGAKYHQLLQNVCLTFQPQHIVTIKILSNKKFPPRLPEISPRAYYSSEKFTVLYFSQICYLFSRRFLSPLNPGTTLSRMVVKLAYTKMRNYKMICHKQRHLLTSSENYKREESLHSAIYIADKYCQLLHG